MTPAEAIGEVWAHQIVLAVCGDAAECDAPAGALTDGLPATIVEHNAEILKLLGRREVVAAVRAAMARVSPVYRVGLRDRLLRERDSTAWDRLEALEETFDTLMAEGRFEAARTARAGWERAWGQTIEGDAGRAREAGAA